MATKAKAKAGTKAKPQKKAADKKVVKGKKTKSSTPKPAAKKAVVGADVKVSETKKTPVRKSDSPAKTSAGKHASSVAKRSASMLTERRRNPVKHATLRTTQFNFMKAPGLEYEFEVGDTVEVFCDHEKNRDRIRGWVKGIIVQVDHKLAAVQFRSNVYLTDGWMVPDRILWFPVNSEHIRPVAGKKPAMKKEMILPDY